MVFVGRRRETSRIAAALTAGANVVVAGTYGIGRSALVRHVAEVMGDAWRFVFLDFSRSPAQLCSDLIGRLRPLAGRGPARGTRSFVSARAMALKLEPRGRRRHVLALDNVAALTVQKSILLRRLVATGRYRFVAIAETHMPETDLFKLRAGLVPVRLVTLANLPNAVAREFFIAASDELGLGWNEEEVAVLANVTGGHPLLMVDTAAGAAQRLGKVRGDSSGQWTSLVPAPPPRLRPWSPGGSER